MADDLLTLNSLKAEILLMEPGITCQIILDSCNF